MKLLNKARKMERESSTTMATLDTPFLERATHKYCLTAETYTSVVMKTGPAFCRMEASNSRLKILERSS